MTGIRRDDLPRPGQGRLRIGGEPRMEASAAVSPLSRVRADPASAGAGFAAAGRALAQAADEAVRAAEEQQRRDETIWRASNAAQARARWTEELMRAQEEAPENPDGFSRGLLERYDAWREQELEKAPSENTRRIAEVDLLEVRTWLGGRALEYEAGARLAYRRTQARRTVDLNSSAALGDPDSLPALWERTDAAIGATGLTGRALEEERTRARAELGQAALAGVIQRTPDRAIEEIDRGVWGEWIPGERLPTLRAAAESQARQRRNEAEARARAEAAEARAALAAERETLRFELDDAVAALSAGRGVDIDRSRIVRVFGDQAPRILRRLDDAAETGRVVSTVAAASPEELAAEAARLEARLSDTAAPGYRDAQTRAEAFGRAVAARNRALRDDPAGYAMNRQVVRDAWAAAAQAPAEEAAAATDRAVAATLAEQERLGVPEERRRVLPEAEAERLAGEFRTAARGVTAAGGDPRGADAAQLAQALSARYGRHWPRVYGELVAESRIPDGVVVVAGMTAPGQARAAQILAGALREGRPQVEAAVGAEAVRQVRDEALAALEPFARTVAASPGGSTVLGTYRAQVELLAMEYVRRGQRPRDAAAAAAREIVLGQYEWRDTFRVPRGFDADDVERRAAAALRAVDGLDAPPSGDRRMEPDAARAAYVREVRRGGRWITAPDESGLVLIDPLGFVVTREGEPVRVPFARPEGEEAPARRDPAARGPRPPAAAPSGTPDIRAIAP